MSTIPQYVTVHDIDIAVNFRDGLLAFYAISGSDTTSTFSGIGKKTTWNIFQEYPKFLSGLGESRDIHEDVAEEVEAFVGTFDLNTPSHSINDVRAAIFCSYKSNLDNLPPMTDLLCNTLTG